MEFHYYQIVPMILTIWIGFLTGKALFFFLKGKHKKMWVWIKRLIYPVILIVFFLLFNPVKLTESNMSVHENVNFNDIPKKVEVEQTDYEQYHNNQLNQLKEESKNALK